MNKREAAQAKIDNSKEFNKLYAKLKKKGLSQMTIANALGISQPRLSLIVSSDFPSTEQLGLLTALALKEGLKVGKN